jgi:DNA repair protein RadA/Sms
MARTQVTFICNSCGAVHARWMGKCPDCGEWDSLDEHREAAGASASKDRQRGETVTKAAPAVSIKSIDTRADDLKRLATGIGEFDRVLGGTVGIVGWCLEASC